MKKVNSALLLAAALLILASGCGDPKKTVLEPPGATTAQPVSTQPDTSGTPTSGTPTASPAPEEEIKVYLNGNRLTLTSAPEADGDLVLVPVAEICACFSREITATSKGGTLTLTDTEQSKTIVLTEGERTAEFGGSSVELKEPVKRSADGVFFLELSGFSALFDADAKYQADILTAYITESGLC